MTIKRDRVRLALAAFMYECTESLLMSDSDYDLLALRVYANKLELTDKPELDAFFRDEVSPDTGMWVYNHPELAKIKQLARRISGALSPVV